MTVVLVAAGVAIFVVTDDETASHPDQWDRRMVDLVAFVEDERGLHFDHPVAVDFLTAEQYSERTRVDEAEVTREDRRLMEEGTAPLRALGLLPTDFDALEAANDLSDTGTLAYYDPMTERIAVRGTEMTVDLRVTLAHELVHVLQDQHFDLEDMLDDGDLTRDQLAAYLALIEGDATRIQLAYVRSLPVEERDSYLDTTGEAFDETQEQLAAIPGVLVAMEGAPYTLGSSLVELIAAEGGNDAVDDAFDDPPASTEHMVDPRAYFAGDPARDVTAPDVPVDGEQVGEPDRLGALPLFLVLSERIDPLVALTAVDGWGGDAFVVYERGDTTCMDLAAAGDSARDDGELLRAFDAWGNAAPPGAARVRSEGGVAHVSICAPPRGAEPTSVALDALTLPAVRAQIMLAAGEASDPDEAFGVADCFVRAVPLDKLVEANESLDPPAEAMTAIDRAVAKCGLG